MSPTPSILDRHRLCRRLALQSSRTHDRLRSVAFCFRPGSQDAARPASRCLRQCALEDGVRCFMSAVVGECLASPGWSIGSVSCEGDADATALRASAWVTRRHSRCQARTRSAFMRYGSASLGDTLPDGVGTQARDEQHVTMPDLVHPPWYGASRVSRDDSHAFGLSVVSPL